MTQPNAQTTVGELVRERPARSRVFEQHRIDYCCGGKRPLAEACAERKLDLALILRELEASDRADERLVDADAMSLSTLADHIEATHHAYLREELPRLDFMTRKVAAVHGDTEPRLRTIREVFIAFEQELSSHMLKEEQVLFPMIREIESTDTAPQFHCGSLANPISQMESEHDSAGNALAQFRSLTDDYTPPEWACNTFRALYDALAELERNMHQHVHKENNVLFPKALRREAQLAATPAGAAYRGTSSPTRP
ncbi:iron-sulfur cluster repair di-iron protein [Ruficoccus amylovorans]|uniref:Iron-sulfur cluster repair di-iron protein n=1 Tax=Ruficoccus amylovorans TaxID=1804625 RepID=A0A842H922_9BACT|nr:iron-sulfur cluster repair di-iron protein [Ruficoccus amylovorans]MBC2592902.1 iron-sulfur cluster repair di-iron protein [Ruficoccus amylovorans]